MPNPERHPIRGYLAIATATFLWGASATLGKAVFTGRLFGGPLPPIDPMVLAQTRVSFSLLVLFPVLLALRGRGGLALPRRDLGHSMLLGTAGITGSNYFYYLAIEKTTVATAIILQYTAPVLVLLYMVARRLQRPTLQRVFAVAAAVAGSMLAIGLGSDEQLRLNPLGVGAALGAALCFAFYNVQGHSLLVRHDRWRVMTYALIGASAFWLAVNPPWKLAAASYSGAQWLFLFVFALGSWLLPFSFYFLGLHYLDATRAVVTSCLEPVFAIVIAHLYVDETLGFVQVIGIVVVLAATIVIQLPEKNEAAAAAAAPPGR